MPKKKEAVVSEHSALLEDVTRTMTGMLPTGTTVILNETGRNWYWTIGGSREDGIPEWAAEDDVPSRFRELEGIAPIGEETPTKTT